MKTEGIQGDVPTCRNFTDIRWLLKQKYEDVCRILSEEIFASSIHSTNQMI